MATSVAPPRKQKHQRLRGLNGATPTPIGVPQPVSHKEPTPSPLTAAPPAAVAKKYTCCDAPHVRPDDEGGLFCDNCYTQISESNIVADVTFQEDSRGAAAVQGGFVQSNSRHASTLGANVIRAAGAGERNSAQEIERNARKALDKLCPTLGIAESIRSQAINIFALASRGNFSAGRRTDEVAAASLYAACRRQKENTVMLIDISELLRMNVFRLGEVYKDLCKDLHLNEHGGIGTQFLVDAETLVWKYCRKLEFGDKTREVATDAVQIVKRMKRDWMVTGRHPAGICGAAIILAARMSNFRRSSREVVYVAKVADITIGKRINEFRRLKAAALTVDDFRNYGVRLKGQADPPVLYESELKKNKLETLKRKRQESTAARDTVELPDESQRGSREASTASTAVGEDSEGPPKRPRTEADAPATPPDTQQEPRRDADGFVIPPLPRTQTPAGQERQGSEEPRRGRGRPKKTPPQPIIITEEQLALETELLEDINENLNDEEIIDLRNEVEKMKSEEQSRQIANQQKQIAADSNKARRAAEGITWITGGDRTHDDDVVSDDDLEKQFANDPEVQNCLLSEKEQRVKEQIWVTHNEDWLRQQQEKALIAQVEKAHGKDTGKRRKGGKKKRSKFGDGTTLAELETPVETPAQAAAAMLQKRNAPLSKFIDWEMLNATLAPSSSRSTSTRGSATPTTKGGLSNGGTPVTGRRAADGGQDGSASPLPAAGSEGSPSPSPSARNPNAAVPESADSTPAPMSPPQTQAGAEEDIPYDPDDYYASDDEPAYDDDEREDIGEEDYNNTMSGRSDVHLQGEYYEEYE